MEILLFIFPLLSFLLFQFFSQKIKTVFLHALNIFLLSLAFLLSLRIFMKILDLDKNLPLYFYILAKNNNFFIDWSLRFDLLVAFLIILVTFTGLLLTIYSINLSKSPDTGPINACNISIYLYSFDVYIFWQAICCDCLALFMQFSSKICTFM